MPKFLDAPSWYDKNGDQRTIVTTMRIGMSNTGHGSYCNVPVISEGSINLGDIPEQPLYTLPFGSSQVGGVPYWSGRQNGYLLTPQGSTGQVLTSRGSNAGPGWADIDIPPLYMHKIYLYASSITFRAIATVYSMSSTSITNNTVDDLLTFLDDNGCTGKSNFLPINGCLTGAVAVGIYNNLKKTELYVVTFNASSGGVSEDLNEFTNSSVTNYTKVTETIIAM